MTQRKDPSPSEIAERCLLIQATWTPAEQLKRLRVDLRPMFQRADGIMETISAEHYEAHHERCDTCHE